MKNNDQYLEYYEKVRNNLASEHYKLRKNSLEELRKSIVNGNLKSESGIGVDVLKLIIKCLDDKSEVCRQEALYILMTCVNDQSMADTDVIFSLILRIHKRLGTGNEIERTEEIRLLYVKLLKDLICQQQDKISQFLEEVTDIIINCIGDQYPEIKRVSCECASELAKTTPKFQNYSDKIVIAVNTTLKHKHYRTRVVAVNSLANIVLFGHRSSMELVCGPLSECLLDQNPHVRAAVLRTVAIWFSKLPDRYSQCHRMLPLILTELSEENEEYRNEALNLWHKIGLQYINENETNLKDKNEFLPMKLENYVNDVIRPNLGCRVLVQNEVGKIIPALMKELEDWKTEIRIKSSELLQTIVLHAEERVGLFIGSMFPTLFRACMDTEIIVSRNVINSVEIMGYFLPSNVYWNILMPHLTDNCSNGKLIILASLLKNNPKKEVFQVIPEIITVLSDDNVFSVRDNYSLEYVLKIISKLFDSSESSSLNNKTIYDIYLILVFVMAHGTEVVQNDAIDLIHRLSEIASLSISDLNKLCLPPFFNRLSETCAMWESYSSDLFIFIILLQKFSDDMLQFTSDSLLNILQIVLSSKFDREVIFKILCAIIEFLRNEENIQKKVVFVEKIILGPLKQLLIFKPGKVAEVIRAAASSIIVLFLKRVKKMSVDFTSEIIPLVLSLCEDSYEETRIYSLDIVSCIFEKHGPEIEVDIFSNILIVICDRLNDKSDVVRVKSIQTLKTLLFWASNSTIYKDAANFPDFRKVTQALQLIFIHVDDSNKKIQDAALDLLEEPLVVEHLKLFFTEDMLQTIMSKYTNKNTSALLSKYLRI